MDCKCCDYILDRLNLTRHFSWQKRLKSHILKRVPATIVRIEVLIILFVSIISSLPSVSQSLKTINLNDVPQRKVRKYIISGSIDKMQDYTLIHSSWKRGSHESDFNVVEKIIHLKFNIARVWDCYRHSDPARIWNRQSVRLGLLISKYSNTAMYVNKSSLPEADTGQVIFLNLKILKGLLNVPVAFEIINIDPLKQVIEFSYLDYNKSKGKQSLQFFDDGDGCTTIVHRSYFKSGSSFRDNILYPLFHKKFVKDFHRNMKHLVKNTIIPSNIL
jgi:hypothetical protein